MGAEDRRAMRHEEPHTCPASWRTMCDMCTSLSCIGRESRLEPDGMRWRCYCDALGRAIEPREMTERDCPRRPYEESYEWMNLG